MLRRLKSAIWRWAVTRRPGLLTRLLSLSAGHALATTEAWQYATARMVTSAMALVTCNKVPGDYCEFGVYEGLTFAHAWHAARLYALTAMRFHAFDSFAGLPEPSGPDADGSFRRGEFAAPRSSFERALRRAGADLSRVTVTEGWFDQTLTPPTAEKIGLTHVAVAWIDCDLYSSTVSVLDFLAPLLPDGAVLCFDDWFCFNARADRGQQRAVTEWLARNHHLALVPYRDFHYAGKAFVVNRQECGASDGIAG
jgi:hypothetical protein